MHIAELWRYPVKSMAGEPVTAIELTAEGFVGDRVVHVRDARGRVLTSRTRPKLLGLHATWEASRGEPLVEGRPWYAPETTAAVRQAAGDDATLARYEGPERFDVLPLLVATDGAIARFGEDRRRLRPNVVIADVEGLAERDWPGRRLAVGEVVIEVASVRQRCVMTTYDPDTQQQRMEVLRRIVKEFGGRLGLDCSVITGGRLAVGDPVRLC